MKCIRIEAHLIRTEPDDKFNKTIVAFNARYHFHGFLDGNIAVFLLEEEGE